MSRLRTIFFSILLVSTFFSSIALADPPVISVVSGDGPFPIGTTITEMVVSTDVDSGCRYNDADDGNLPQWALFPSSDSLIHSVQVPLINDQDTNRYIRCKNLSTNEINSTSFIFTITFANDNAAPIISSVALTSATEDVAYSYDVDATDPDVGDVLSFTLSSFPSGMTIDPASGLISWVPSNEQVGNQPVVVEVSDSGGLSDSQNFSIAVTNVNDAPSIISAAVTSANEDTNYSYDVDASDPDVGDSLTFSLSILPSGMSIDASTGIINWTPDNSQIGNQSVEVIVTDSSGLNDVQNFIILVSETNNAPTITSVAITNATENIGYVYDVDASDSNVADTMNFSLTGSPTGMTIDTLSGLINWTPTNAQVGDQSVVVVVSDNGGLTDSQSFTIAVANVNQSPSISSAAITTATESAVYTYDVDATDPDAGDIVTFSLTTSPSGMSIAPSSGVINWTPTNAQLGGQTVVLVATDQAGLTDSQTFTVTVNPVNSIGPTISYVSGSGPYPSGTTTANMVISTDVSAGCRFNDADDGNLSGWPILSSSDNLVHSVQIPLSNDENTNRYIRCKSNDSNEINPNSYVFSITFEAVNVAPSMTSIAVVNATQDLPYTYDVDATDPDAGDSLTFSLTGFPTGMTIDNATGVIGWTPTNEQVGDNSVVAVVTDDGGLSDSQGFTIVVADVNDAPSISSTAVTTANESSVYVYDVNASDPDVGDTLIFSLTTQPTGMSIDASTGIINWTPAGEQIGNNEVVVIVTDTEGLTDTQNFTIAVDGVNLPPQITSTANLSASENIIYSYLVTATDPNTNDVLSFSLTTFPEGMGIDVSTGVISWTPTTEQLGDNAVTAVVSDLAGLTDLQSFTIDVANVNDAPSITSTAIVNASENSLYVYDVEASDPDVGDILTFSLAVQPTGMTIDASSGLINWTSNATQVGSNAIEVVVTDLAGLTDLQSFDIEVLPLDSDNDGIPDLNDICPDTPVEEVSDANGCSPSQLDTDNDGVTDDIDQCPGTPTNEIADPTGCSPSQTAGPYKRSSIPQTGSNIVNLAMDDADLKWGTVRSYTRDNTNETVSDNTNNLIWQDDVDSQSSTLNWTDAGTYCQDSNLAGITDWRLPTPLELLYLLDLGDPTLESNNKVDPVFINKAAEEYWTDEQRLAFSSTEGDIDYALAVDFGLGEIISDPDNEINSVARNVRCVSGAEQFAPLLSNLGRFSESMNVVYDSRNGLMWQEDSEVGTERQTLAESISYCDALTLDGSTDWRLPNLNEYHTISTYSQNTRNILFALRDDMWSSTTYDVGLQNPYANRLGWGGFGFIYQDRQVVTFSHYPRCVRDYSEPVAVSGGDRTVSVGDSIVLDASQSYDPDGGSIVFYRWFDDGSLISVEMVASDENFTIGEHQLELVVTDNNSISGSEFFTLTVVAEANVAPVATSEAVEVNEDEFIDIILQATDSNGDNLTYEFVDLPANGDVVLVGQNTATYTPNADYFGADSFTFKVSDGVLDSNVATVAVSVLSVNGGAPTAVAGDDQVVTLGDIVTLDGSQSSDDELVASYQWTESGVVLSNEVSFSLDNLTAGNHTITLQVFDAEGLDSTDTLVINVLYQLSQCITAQPIDDPGFDASVPDENIAWIGSNYVDVKEIELAFNNARFFDKAIFQYLSMPDQLTWDSWTIQQQGLYLINSERQARNLTPLSGADPEVISVVTNYAEYIRSSNEVISHTRSSDGASPSDRLDENTQLVGNYYAYYENIAAMYEPISVSKATIQAIYTWLYEDKFPLSGASWGHRLGILGTTFTDDSGNEFEEGLLGFGVAVGGYDPLGVSVDGQGAVVVYNAIGPNADWDHSTAELVDTGNAQLCNDNIELSVDETLINTADLVALTISPTNISLTPGDSQSLQVFGIFADNRQEDFTSSVSFVADSRSVVSVNSGVVTGENIGVVSIYSRINGIDSNRIRVTVGAETNTDNLQGTVAEQYLPYIPGNATVDHYDPLSFSVFNGFVSDRDGLPLSGVSVAFHNAPEYGSVETDNEGKFVLAGGAGYRSLVYTKEGHLTIQRTTIGASNAWATLPDVIMLAHDTKMTSIDLTSVEPQVHQSTIITDAFGSRSTTLVFDNISSVTVTSKDGIARILNDFLVRATENEFPQSMPADLPKESNFTYCSALEIVGVGDQESVLFDNPVVMYVDNFLNFPVGEIVPIGYFTGKITEWEASENGIVVKLLDASGDGLVDGVDYTGDDIADDIDGDGSTLDEIAGVENYSPGDLYWRGSFDHFTWYDFNWGWAEPIERLELFPETSKEDDKDKDKKCTNSYVKPKPLAFHEDIEITGTNLTLHYSSQRTEDYHHKISVNVSGDSIEPEVIEMIAVLEIGGNRFEQTFSPAIYQDAEFIWDGTEPSGQVINGVVRGKISIGYRYASEYLSAGNVVSSGQPLDSFATAWAQIGSGTTGVAGRDDAITWSTSSLTIMNAPESHIANGWSISNHHLNTGFDLIYRGDGEAEKVNPASLVLKTGITRTLYDGDDGYYQKGGSEINYNIDDQGVLTDDVTKLQWQYRTGSFELFSTKTEATNYCAALVLGNDNTQPWRLPTFKELSYTIDKSNGEHDFFIYQLGATNYWSQQILDDGTSRKAACVKGETLDERYAANLVRNDTDNVVIDEENGLMWQDVAENSSEIRTWTESIDYCEALDHAGFTDWRLANINELLVALPNTVFTYQTVLPDDQGPWFPGVSFRKPYWASTLDAINDSAAWSIESEALGTGYTQDELFYARCVRNDLTRSRSPYIFDQDGKHIKTIDLDSGITLTTFLYNEQDQLISISDRFNNTITIERDAQGKATSIISPDGYTTKLTIDTNNNLMRAEYDDTTGYDFVYFGSLMTDETDPNRNLFVKTYDAEGRIINTTDPEQGVWEFFNIKNEVNRIVTYGFTSSENNRYETVESLLANGDSSLITTVEDGSIADVVRQSDDLKESSTSSSVVTTIDNVFDPKIKLEIPQTITITLPSGLTKITSLDKSYAMNGTDSTRATLTITNNGQISRLTENFKTGERVITSAEGRTSIFRFDPLTRLIESQQVTGFNEVNHLYDTRGRLKSSTIGDRTTIYTYDDAFIKGNIASIIDAENRETSFEYDLLGRLTKMTYPDGRIVEQAFDGNGNLTSFTPSGQPAHVFNYNSVNKKNRYTPPDVASVGTPATTYDYDRDRKLTRITRPDNQELIFNYKVNTDQLTDLVIPTGSFRFGYDSSQELTSITAPNDEGLSFTLDGTLQTKTVWSGSVTGDVELVFNNQFQIAEQKVNGANSVSLGYDNDYLLTSIGMLSIDRDAISGLISGSTLSNLTTSQSYSGFTEISNYNALYNSTTLYNVDYTQDKLGRIVQQIEAIEGVSRTLSYAYDLAGRLVQVKIDGVETESYGYDNNGNRTHIVGVLTATYDTQDRLLTHGEFTYTYTDNGELLTKTNTINSEVTSYVYDALGNLTEVNLPDGTKIEFVIDGLNRRVGKKVNGTLTKGWLYQDQLNPIAELDGNNNITARFIYGDKLNVPSYMEKNGQTYRIISDHLGSPRLIVNIATGLAEQKIEFDTWGNVIQDNNPEFQPFGFAGGLYDAQTELTKFGVRDYDAQIGRWISKDPIGFDGGSTGFYSYVGNDPINSIDVNGKWGVPGAIYGAFSGGVGGYIAGGWSGVFYGIAAGAAVGAVNPFGASAAGAAAAAFAASYAGQFAGNFATGKDLLNADNYSLMAALGAAVGGGIGGPMGNFLSRIVDVSRSAVIGSSLTASSISATNQKIIQAFIEGAVAGAGELTGQELQKYLDKYLKEHQDDLLARLAGDC